MSAPLEVVVIDDEPLAREALAELVAAEPALELVGEAADGLAAVELIDGLEPDLAFLDIRMPGLDGVEVLARIEHTPWIVLTTAHGEYALEAFELGVLDYLLKPFGKRRFRTTLDRVLRRRAARGADDVARARQVLRDGPIERLFARRGDRIVPVEVARIERIDAERDYSRVVAGDDRLLVRVSLGELARRLGAPFVRIHRSHLVRVAAIRELRPFDDRRWLVVLASGARLVASRNGTCRLRRLVD